MKLRWLRSASASLRLHVRFIASNNPTATARVRRAIRRSVLRLPDFPESWRIGQVPDTREFVVAGLPYLIVYRVTGDTVEILRVFHTSQERSTPVQ